MNDKTIADIQAQRIQNLRQRGIEFEINEHGQLLITHIPEIEQKMMEMLMQSIPCWFPGCQEIQDSYISSIKSLTADCTKCESGGIMRQHLDRAKTAYLLYEAKTNVTHTGDRSVSGSGLSNGEGTLQTPELLPGGGSEKKDYPEVSGTMQNKERDRKWTPTQPQTKLARKTSHFSQSERPLVSRLLSLFWK